MRGTDAVQESLFTIAKQEDCVSKGHPLRAVREQVNEALVRLLSARLMAPRTEPVGRIDDYKPTYLLAERTS